MIKTKTLPIPRNFKRISFFLSCTVSIVGFLVLLGWLLNIPVLKSIMPCWVSMKANAALCFLLAGLSLLFQHHLQLKAYSFLKKALPFTLAGIYGFISMLVACQYLFNINLGIDELIFKDDINPIGTFYPGRMAPATALCFILLSFSILLNDVRFFNRPVFQYFALLAIILSFVVITGYLFGFWEMTELGGFVNLAFHTAICFLLLSFATLFARPQDGLMRLISSNTVGGKMIRIIFPAVIIFITLIGWVHLRGEYAGFYGAQLGNSIYLASFIILFGIVLFKIAFSLTKLEKQIIESEGKFRQVFECSPMGISITAIDGALFTNNAFCKIVGYSQSELRAFNWKQITHTDDITKNEEIVQSILRGERSSAFFEKRYIHKSGHIVFTEINTTIQRDENGKPLFFITIINDVSERNKIVQELSLSVTELKKTELLLYDKVSELDIFLYRASHDLKSPVSSLKGLITLIKKEITDVQTLEYLKLVEQTNNRMENIVNDLLSVVLIKDESRKQSEINFSEVIHSTIAMFEFLPAFEKIRIEVEIQKDLCFFSDNILILTICQNLIGNAIKYRLKDEGHKISIFAKMKDGGVLLTVLDNGEGISVKPIERIFEMFYRGNLKSTGTGLGLYIVKKAVEKLNGTIKVESQPRRGATFTVFFPLAPMELNR